MPDATTPPQDEMVARYGEPLRTEMVPCVTEQWNHPFTPDLPFVGSDGLCAVCRQVVEWDQYQPDSDYVYSRIAKPHERRKRWFAVSDIELADLHGYRERW